MGQKANPKSVRLSHYPEVFSIDLAHKESSYLAYVKSYILQYFRQKGIFISKMSLVGDSTKLYLNLDVFFSKRNRIKTKKLRRAFKSQKGLKLNTSVGTNFGFIKFCQVLQQILGVRKVVLKIRKLECKMEVNQLVTFWSSIKKALTFRRTPFASDLVQAAVLLLNNQATAHLFNTFLVLMFSRLTKRQHSRFFVFLKKFFKGILTHSQMFNGPILGIRLLISGKLSGKTRAQSFAVNVGQVPTQTLDCNIDYSYVPAFTMMGTFGFKLWIAIK